jgi:hypothetical protein
MVPEPPALGIRDWLIKNAKDRPYQGDITVICDSQV